MKIILAVLMIFAMLFLFVVPALHAETKKPIQRLGETDLTVIHTKMRFTTVILLPDGEEISEVTCGDKEYWVIEGKDGIVYVKPAKEGAMTNVNVVSKNKVVYSFIVQEITKPGSKGKPDLKVILAGDEVTKLRKDKENLEELLSRTEQSLKQAAGQDAGAPGKKKEEPLVPSSVVTSWVGPSESTPVAKADFSEIKSPEATTKSVVVAIHPQEAVAEVPPHPAPSPAEFQERPIATATVIDRKQGLLRRVGRFFQRVSQALRLY